MRRSTAEPWLSRGAKSPPRSGSAFLARDALLLTYLLTVVEDSE